MSQIISNLRGVVDGLRENISSTFTSNQTKLNSLLNKIMIRTSHNIIDPTSVSSSIHKPNVPICCSIPNGSLELGTLISIYGTLNSGGKGFRIDFFDGKCQHIHDGNVVGTIRGDSIEGNEPEKIAFHFNPRIGGGNDMVVMNSFIQNQWQEELRQYERPFPFVRDQPFRLMILVEEQMFKIAVDGQHMFEFPHRSNFRDIARMHIEGDVMLDLIEFRKELRYLSRTDSSSSISTIESNERVLPPVVEATAPALQQQQQPQSNQKGSRQSRSVEAPQIPFFEQEPKLSKPCDIYVAGMLPNYIQENLVINLVDSSVPQPESPQKYANIPFHISIRADLGVIVRNTYMNGVWGEEEIYLEVPYQMNPGTHFDLMISNLEDRAVVAINGQRAFEYKHRLDPKTIDALQIFGAVVLTSVRYEFKQ